jgi:hypothetical protein
MMTRRGLIASAASALPTMATGATGPADPQRFCCRFSLQPEKGAAIELEVELMPRSEWEGREDHEDYRVGSAILDGDRVLTAQVVSGRSGTWLQQADEKTFEAVCALRDRVLKLLETAPEVSDVGLIAEGNGGGRFDAHLDHGGSEVAVRLDLFEAPR